MYLSTRSSSVCAEPAAATRRLAARQNNERARRAKPASARALADELPPRRRTRRHRHRRTEATVCDCVERSDLEDANKGVVQVRAAAAAAAAAIGRAEQRHGDDAAQAAENLKRAARNALDAARPRADVGGDIRNHTGPVSGQARRCRRSSSLVVARRCSSSSSSSQSPTSALASRRTHPTPTNTVSASFGSLHVSPYGLANDWIFLMISAICFDVEMMPARSPARGARRPRRAPAARAARTVASAFRQLAHQLGQRQRQI